MSTVEAELERIYHRYVTIDHGELQENIRIANTFVDGFINFMDGEKPRKFQQGSSFEGLKVSLGDDIDFLLVYNFENHSDVIRADQSVNVRGVPDILECWQLKVDPMSRNRAWISDWVDHSGILAPHLFRRKMQSNLASYVRQVKSYNGIHGVKSYTNPVIGNPAMTIVLTKTNGKKISIDMSIAVDIKMMGGHVYTKRFLAKQHERDVDGLLWRVTRESQELAKIREIDPRIKENYKVAKYLLADVVCNSFILKTAMFHLNQNMSHQTLLTKSGFLAEIIRYLLNAYKSRSLPGFFNRAYNVLGTYEAQYLSDKANQLQALVNRMDVSRDMAGMVRSLMP